jgi:hypothetical protein
MTTLTVSPAYGRDYRKKGDAEADWTAGKDFRIEGFGHYAGAYVSSRDMVQLKADGYDSVSIRYSRFTRQTFVKL